MGLGIGPWGDDAQGRNGHAIGVFDRRGEAMGKGVGHAVEGHDVDRRAQAGGDFGGVVGRDAGMAILRLNSGEQRLVPGSCLATIGAVSNPDHGNTNDGKAGRTRWRGKTPHNRGVVMNPVDHPHGGGEGRTSGGRHPVTPWGKPTKGARTRHNKQTDKMIIRSRHAKKKR